MDIAVYVFTGFIEAGKTTLINETLADPRFNTGERTLILACEQGIEEYEPDTFPHENVFLEIIEKPSQLNTDKLSALQRKYKAERVMIEYNGMWLNEELYKALPQNWYIYQEIMSADANTFLNYDKNARAYVVDKLKNCELVAFNRFSGDEDRKTALHKVVRSVSRAVNIVYEYPDHTVEYDEIEDPLPYDLSADVVEIADRDFAIFYRDLAEDVEKYNGKTVRFTGIVLRDDKKLPKNNYIVGRHVMTCCADDITYCHFVCEAEGASSLQTEEWVSLTAKIQLANHKLYRGRGPVLREIAIERQEPLSREERLATFY